MNRFTLQIGKIVGTAQQEAWAQTHVFLPDDKKKRRQYGGLLVSFALQPRQKEIDTVSFGKEIISRFHEIYYSSEEKAVLKRLRTSIKRLVTEFEDRVELQIAASVVIEGEQGVLGYFGQYGPSRIVIFRDQQLATLVKGEADELKTASGHFKDEDLVVLASGQFFQLVERAELKEALVAGQVNGVAESLAPIVHSDKDNGQTSAVIFQLQITPETQSVAEEKPSKTPESKEKKPSFSRRRAIKRRLFKLSLILKNIPVLARRFSREFKGKPDIFIRDKKRKARAKKTTLSVAVILIGLLLTSIILGSRKKVIHQEARKVKGAMEAAEYKYEEAISLAELNPLRARSLLTEAKESIKEALVETEKDRERDKLEQLLNQVEGQLEKVAGEHRLTEAEVFLDFNLVKEGFRGANWGATPETIAVLDKDAGRVIEVEVGSQAAKVAAGGDRLSRARSIAVSDNRLFILKGQSLIVVDRAKGEVIDEQSGDDWGEIVAVNGFAGNAYLLDISKGKIWKYVGIGDGLSSATNYLNSDNLNFQGAVSLTIDGSVWVLFSDGTIIKFTRGTRDAFLVSGLDQELEEPEKIYTNQNLDHLYILDRQNTRVVVIDKETGEYTSQYIWPGIAGAWDIFASEEEKKILLLTGERIYEFELRD